MSLLFKTTLLSGMMMTLCLLPILLLSIESQKNGNPQRKTKSRVQKKRISRRLFLIGTGALIGICCFDLVPDVIEMGGKVGLWIVFVVWVIYSGIHLLHYRKHHQQDCQQAHPDQFRSDQNHQHHEDHLHAGSQGVAMFLTSMILHCISSGMMLAISVRYPAVFSRAVFLALLAHKGYESLVVSSILLERITLRSQAMFAILTYALALPAGVGIALAWNDQINEKLALFATCFALGTLLGCMIFDFILPSLVHLKKQKVEAGWIFFGLLLTQLFMKMNSG